MDLLEIINAINYCFLLLLFLYKFQDFFLNNGYKKYIQLSFLFKTFLKIENFI